MLTVQPDSVREHFEDYRGKAYLSKIEQAFAELEAGNQEHFHTHELIEE